MTTLVKLPVKVVKKSASGLRKSGQWVVWSFKELTKEEPPDPNKKTMDFSNVKTEWIDIAVMAGALSLPIGYMIYKLWKGTFEL